MNAMKLGAVAFFLPYFFVLNPALVGRAGAGDVAFAGITGFLGAVAMAYGLFGFLRGRINVPIRFLFFAGGLMMLFPEHVISLVGLGIALATLVAERVLKKPLTVVS